MAISPEFQKRFQELVAETNEKTKTATAQKLGISYALFTKAYNYGILLKPQILARIADRFEVSLDYLLGLSDNCEWERPSRTTSFHERFAALLASKELTAYELSKRTHINKSNISQWKKFDYVPVLADLLILADFFDVSLDYLLGRTDNPRR